MMKDHNIHYVNKFIHPYHGTECHVFITNEGYYYTDALENHTEYNYICKKNEDYIDALADIFF